MDEFIPTEHIGWKEMRICIQVIDTLIKAAPPRSQLRYNYIKLFKGSEIEKLLFSAGRFEEAASGYCEEAGWKPPS